VVSSAFHVTNDHVHETHSYLALDRLVSSSLLHHYLIVITIITLTSSIE
jgi:hypothetical protein